MTQPPAIPPPRAMVVPDAEAVAALVRTAFAAQSVATDPPPSARLVTAADIEAHLQRGGGGAVIAADGMLAGSVMWEQRDGGLYISRLSVSPAWRGRGIAKTLVATAESACRAARLPRLHLSTRLPLIDNRRLFAACGFVETARHAHPGYAEPTFVDMAKVLVG